MALGDQAPAVGHHRQLHLAGGPVAVHDVVGDGAPEALGVAVIRLTVQVGDVHPVRHLPARVPGQRDMAGLGVLFGQLGDHHVTVHAQRGALGPVPEAEAVGGDVGGPLGDGQALEQLEAAAHPVAKVVVRDGGGQPHQVEGPLARQVRDGPGVAHQQPRPLGHGLGGVGG